MNRLRALFWRCSIRKKIVAVTLIGIFGIGLAAFLVSLLTLRTILTQRLCQTNAATVETMASRIDEVFGNSTSAVVGISIDGSIRSQLDLLYSDQDAGQIGAMNTLREQLSNYTYTIVNTPASIALLTSDGRLIYNGDSLAQGDGAFLRQLYEDYMARFSFDSISGQVPVKEWLPNPLAAGEGDPVYCIAMPVRSLTGHNAAIVMMLIRTQYMLSYLEAGDDAWHTRVLVDAGGTIVMAADPEWIGRSVTELSANGTLPGNGAHADTGGAFLFCRRLDNFDGAIYDSMDAAYIDQELWTVAGNLLLLDLAAVALMAAAASLLARSITRPIVRLSERMAERQYADLASDSQGGDEVQVLEYSFDVMQENIRRLMEENRRQEQEKRTTEIRALQSQIRPHFLFNTLNTIRCAVQNENGAKAQDMILALSGLLRMTLVKGEELIPLREELQTLQYYQDIMRMRSSLRLETVYQIEHGLEELLMPKLLLQPLVENCLIHGLKRRRKDGRIAIAAAREADGVYIRVADNGGALDQEDTAAGEGGFSGIGVGNTRRRVQLYFGTASDLRLYVTGDGYTIAEIYLPGGPGPEKEE